LTQTGDALSVQTELSSDFVGFALIALATTLPEIRARGSLGVGDELGLDGRDLAGTWRQLGDLHARMIAHHAANKYGAIMTRRSLVRWLVSGAALLVAGLVGVPALLFGLSPLFQMRRRDV
jgi:hypothetical protein